MSDEKTPETPDAAPSPSMRFDRDADFKSVYANNVQIETTAWDVTLVFGQFDKRAGANVVSQRTAVTMAWPEAKAALHLIFGNMAFYEGINGTIRMPAGLTPAAPQLDVTNPILKNVQERLEKIQALFFGQD